MPICKCCKKQVDTSCSDCILGFGQCCKLKDQFMDNFKKEYKKEHGKKPKQYLINRTLHNYYYPPEPTIKTRPFLSKRQGKLYTYCQNCNELVDVNYYYDHIEIEVEIQDHDTWGLITIGEDAADAYLLDQFYPGESYSFDDLWINTEHEAPLII